MFPIGLYNLLSNDPGIKAALGTRIGGDTGIWPIVAADEAPAPYIVYFQVHREVVLSYEGVNRTQELRYQFSCFADPPYDNVKLLAQAVKDLLDGFTGKLSDGSIIGQSLPNSEHDEVEEFFKATIFSTVLDYTFIVTAPVSE